MIFRNTEYYATYIASAYDKIDRLGSQYGIRIRPLAWAFMFPGERCFEGTRTFTTQGIDKAVFNMFKIYGSLGDEKLAFASDGTKTLEFLQEPEIGVKNHSRYTGEGEDTEVAGFAVRGKNGEIQIVIYSHCNDRDKEETQEISLTVEGIGEKEAAVSHYRIDSAHSNAYAEWIKQGRPLFPSGEQYDAIKKKDGLEKLCADKTVMAQGCLRLDFCMPSHAVSYLVIQ